MTYFPKDKEINLLFEESEKMYRKLIESVKNGVFMADSKGRLFFINQAFVDILGYSQKGEMLGMNLDKIFVNADEWQKFFKAMEKNGFVRDYEAQNICRDGSTIILSITSNFIRNEREEIIGVEGIVINVTEKRRLEDMLKVEKMKLEQILDFNERVSSMHKIDNLIGFVVQKVTTILNADKCSLMLLDDQKKQLIIKKAKGLSEEIIKNTKIQMGEGIAGSVAKNGHDILVRNIEYDKRFERKSRPTYSGRSFMSAAIRSKGKLIGVVNVTDKNKNESDQFNEVDLKILNAIARQSGIAIENAKLYDELEHLSVTDPLTNLSNYRFFVRSVDEEIQRVNRFSGTFSLLMIDVDNFKSYNDKFGHLAGDDLLRTLGELLTQNLRSLDKACRYGGDEFVILLPGVNVDEARVVAEKLRAKVDSLELESSVTISVGVMEFKQPLSRFEFTLRADKALYQAKRAGKNLVHVYNTP